MKNSSRLTRRAGLALAALAMAAVPVCAQLAGPVLVAPIIIHTLKPKKDPTPGTWMKVEVLRVDANSMMVSEQDNERVIHTYTYSDDLKTKIQKKIDGGNYQYGDKIKVLVAPGNAVALKIHGKPSKPH